MLELHLWLTMEVDTRKGSKEVDNRVQTWLEVESGVLGMLCISLLLKASYLEPLRVMREAQREL
jgi:hypothetical protein